MQLNFYQENETLFESLELIINFRKQKYLSLDALSRGSQSEMKARDESKLRNDCSSHSAIDYEQKVTAHNTFKREVTTIKSYCT